VRLCYRGPHAQRFGVDQNHTPAPRRSSVKLPTSKIVEVFNKESKMGTVNFSVPDDVKEAFNAAFAGQNKSAIVAQLMREAVERAELKRRSQAAITRVLQARPRAPVRSVQALRAVREKGRA
jgi:hypothetical protein